MNKTLQNYRERFDALTLRERLLSVLVVLVACYVVVNTFLLGDVESRREQISLELKDWSSRNEEIDKRIAEMTALVQGQNIGSQSQQLQIQELTQKVKQSEQRLQDLVVQFVRPEQMVEILREVLKQEPGLKLMKVQSTGAENLFLSAGKSANLDELETKHTQVMKLLKHYRDRNQLGVQADVDKMQADISAGIKEQQREEKGIPQVYKHGILIELRGSFNATLKYLRMLEQLPWKFYWDAMRFEVLDYPQAKISIVINTLSLDKEWVRV